MDFEIKSIQIIQKENAVGYEYEIETNGNIKKESGTLHHAFIEDTDLAKALNKFINKKQQKKERY